MGRQICALAGGKGEVISCIRMDIEVGSVVSRFINFIEMITIICLDQSLIQYLIEFSMFNEETTKKAFLQLMQQPDCDSWLRGKDLIDTLLKYEPFLSQSFKIEIKSNFNRVKNVLMLIYLYHLEIEISSYYSFKDQYVQKFNEICKQKECTYAEISLWINEQKGEVLQNILEFIVETFSKFLHKKIFIINSLDLQFLIRAFNQMELKTNCSTLLAMEFISVLQKITVAELNQYDCKQNAIIIAILKAIASDQKGKGNLSLLIDEYLMGRLEEQIIDRFCFMHWSFLSELTATQLLKIFHELFLKGVNAHLLELVIRTTNILAEGEEFFKLKQIYAGFILPVVARRAKGCIREGVEKTALNLCELYSIGFNQHCDIGEIGAQCLLANVQLVTSQNYRKKWIELAFLTAKKEETTLFIQGLLKRKGIEDRIIKECKHGFFEKQPWQITTRNIKQHKNYKKQPSKYKGISNRQFQCYIISVVQALFMTKRLPLLLNKTTKFHKCIDDLKDIFRELQSQAKWKIKVNNLQKDGPAEFASSQEQQDAQQYLLALMNTLQQYFKSVRLQKEFKQIFEISSQTVITCKQCKHETSSRQSEYIHTISNKEKLKIEWEQTIFDFTCAQCHRQESNKRTVLTLTSQILIVHINRFSNVEGRIKKELPSERILRRFENYELVGMVFHIGKLVEVGHYVYYSRLGKKRWVEFNDETTSEFELDDEGEEFEREFKAEKTPYILFYQQMA